MLKHYETPKNVTQLYTFSKSILKLDQFKLMMRSRLQYGAMIGLVDIPARVTAFRYIYLILGTLTMGGKSLSAPLSFCL